MSTSHARHAARTGSPDRTLAVLAAAQFLVVLTTSIVNVALPQVRDGLRLSPAGLSWVVNAYVLRRGAVEPLGVVHHAHDRSVPGDLGEQFEEGTRHREPIGVAALPPAERGLQGVAVPLGEPIEPVPHRPGQLVERRERELHLELDAVHPQRAQAGRTVQRLPQQGRLADPGLAADDEGAASVEPHPVGQPVQHLVAGPAEVAGPGGAVHGPIMPGHRRYATRPRRPLPVGARLNSGTGSGRLVRASRTRWGALSTGSAGR